MSESLLIVRIYRRGGINMKARLRITKSVFALIWTIISAVNYLGIYHQIKGLFMEMFLWSLFIIMAYVLILYAGIRIIKRCFYIVAFRRIRLKYMDTSKFMKQIGMFVGIISYVYGLCYQSSNFIGLIPAILFFYKQFLITGKMFIYINDQLIFLDDKSTEYIVNNINSQDNNTKAKGTKEVA